MCHFFHNTKLQIAVLSIAIFFCAFQVSHNIGKEQIKVWDESSSAKNALEMLIDKHYIVVHADGEPDFWDTKPPLQLWIKVVCMKVFGINEFAVRFPTMVSAILTMVLFSLFFISQFKNYALAFVFVASMSITGGYMGYHVARHGDPDTLLMFFVSIYFIGTFLLLEKYPANRVKYLIIVGTGVLLAAYTKSVAGLAPLAGIAVYFLLRKNGYKLLKDYRFHLTWIAVVLLIGAYYIVREALNPGYLEAVINMEFKTLKEYPGTPKHPEFGFYYNYLKTTGFNPMFFILPIAIVPLIWSRDALLKKLLIYSICAAFFFWLGQSSALMKNEWYIAQIYPFLWTWFSISVYETYRIIRNLIPVQWGKVVWAIVIICGGLYWAGNRYEKIFKYNKKAYTAEKVYVHERSGYILREYKRQHPEPIDLTIYTTKSVRQLQFYTKKYEHLDGSGFNIVRSIDSTYTNQFILSSQKDFMHIADSLFEYELVFENPNGYIIKTKDLK